MEWWRSLRLVRGVLLLLLGLTVVAVAAPGDLDQAFDGDGRRLLDLTDDDDDATAVVVQPDGKIVIGSTGDFPRAQLITRLMPDGSPDGGFAVGGTAVVDRPGDDLTKGIALQPDGRIVAVGSNSEANLGDMTVLRLTAAGAPDPTFAAPATLDVFGTDSADAVAVQPDGRIVVVGTSTPGGDIVTTVLRLTPQGQPDPAFNRGAALFITYGSPGDRGTAVALQPDGKILVGSTLLSGAGVGIARLTTDGTPDPDFDADGKRVVKVTAAGTAEAVDAIAVQGDGRILVAGDGGTRDLAVARLNPDGSPDPAFDGDGVAEIVTPSKDFSYGMALQANGKVLLAGGSSEVNAYDAFIVRLQPGGAPDTTFDFDGQKRVDFGGSDVVHAIALGRDGRIVFAGTSDLAGAKSQILAGALQGDPPAPGAGGGTAGGTGPVAGRAPLCAGRRATIVGTPKRDVLKGTRRADVIVALGGDDVVRAGAGADIVCGGLGKDRLLGGPGPDRLLGQAGADQLTGGAGRDLLGGGAGRDRCLGGPGKDGATCERRIGIG